MIVSVGVVCGRSAVWLLLVLVLDAERVVFLLVSSVAT